MEASGDRVGPDYADGSITDVFIGESYRVGRGEDRYFGTYEHYFAVLSGSPADSFSIFYLLID
jgi:hypothetical protein